MNKYKLQLETSSSKTLLENYEVAWEFIPDSLLVENILFHHFYTSSLGIVVFRQRSMGVLHLTEEVKKQFYKQLEQ